MSKGIESIIVVFRDNKSILPELFVHAGGLELSSSSNGSLLAVDVYC